MNHYQTIQLVKQANSIQDFINNLLIKLNLKEKTNYDNLSAIPAFLGTSLSSWLPQKAVQTYGNKFALKKMFNDNHLTDKTNIANLEKLKDYAKSIGTKVLTPDEVANSVKGDGFKVNIERAALNNSPAFFHEKTNSIGLKNNATAATLAHELGHAEQPNILKNLNLRRLGGLGSAAAFVPWFAEDKDFAQNATLLGTAAQLPTLASEIDASRRGAKLMKNMGMKGRLGAYLGLPSYALQASIPAVSYGIANTIRD